MESRPRDIAVLALRDRAGNVSAHLDRLLAEQPLSSQDRALARELALGVVRRRGTLEAVLSAFLKSPARALPAPLREILHTALYQMLFLDRVPNFAAVNEAVDQTLRFHHRRKSGLVNGVLRHVSREVSEAAAQAGEQAADVLPLGPRAHRRFKRAVFPDPGSNPVGYLAAAMSLPRVLAVRWLKNLGSLRKAADVAMHANLRPPLILRVNRLRSDLQSVAAALVEQGVEAVAHANGHSLVLADWVNVRELVAFRQGLVQPQDPSATAVVEAAGPKPGMRVLDLCAAPGTKTTHLGELMNNSGEIVAVDVFPDRLEKVKSNCARMGVGIVAPMLADKVGGLDPHSFDLVLVDAPCSNTGVLARRPEARWRFTEEGLNRLADDQRKLLRIGERFVRPGGRLVYSTCSIEPEENQQVAKWLAGRHGNVRMTEERLSLPAGADAPDQWHDGGYYAIFSVR